MKIFEGFKSLERSKKHFAYNAYHRKLENYKKYGIITNAINDQIEFKKYRAMFDNKLKVVLFGSVPMPKKLAWWI